MLSPVTLRMSPGAWTLTQKTLFSFCFVYSIYGYFRQALQLASSKESHAYVRAAKDPRGCRGTGRIPGTAEATER